MVVNEFELTNKLYCTFCKKESVDSTLETITQKYDILYQKIFILDSVNTDEYICTYNVDPFNTSGQLLENTILAHRKKDFNVIYTINALNNLIRTLNGGVLDMKYSVDWSQYKNCILLTNNHSDIKKLETKLHKIISL